MIIQRRNRQIHIDSLKHQHSLVIDRTDRLKIRKQNILGTLLTILLQLTFSEHSTQQQHNMCCFPLHMEHLLRKTTIWFTPQQIKNKLNPNRRINLQIDNRKISGKSPKYWKIK